MSKLSFYTTCMGRAGHVQQTLPLNLQAAYGSHAEFIILDYSSPDDLGEWMADTMDIEMRSGRVVYAKLPNKTTFHMSHAKNVAALLCTGEILINLDADAFLGEMCPTFIESVLRQDMRSIVRFGYTGKIAIAHREFLRLGGYDETFVGWGNEDGDFVDRAVASGLKLRFDRTPDFNQRIKHDRADSVKFQNMSLEASSYANGMRRRMNVKRQITKVNPKGYGQATVFVNFNKEPVEVGVE